MTMKAIMRSLRGTQGYTIDQTILIVAIIAILITLVILTVGWSLINRTGGTRLASQLSQVEDSLGLFFGDNKMWPHQSYTSQTPALNMVALAGKTLPGSTISTPRNYVVGLSVSGTTAVNHTLTSNTNKQVFAGVVSNPFNMYTAGQQFYVVEYEAMPVEAFTEADNNIDNGDGMTAGRVRAVTAAAGWSTAATGCGATAANTAPAAAATTVDVCYVANAIQ